MTQAQVGHSKIFVRPLGYRRFGPFTALVDARGWMRVLFRVQADPDNPRVRPQEAWQALLKALPHNATVRFLLSWWPEEAQRLAFVEHARTWPEQDHPERKKLYEALLDTAVHTPLPFDRTLILEFSLPPQEQQAQWLLGIPELLAGYGLTCTPVSPEGVEKLAERVFNPEV